MSTVNKPLTVLVMGDSNVGKSALVCRYINKYFSRSTSLTIRLDLFTANISLDNRNLKMQIWDTAGSERYLQLGTAFYSVANGCILVFDVTSPASFEKLNSWRNEFLVNANLRSPEKFPFLLVGNKVDMEDRKVSAQQALEWCRMNNDIPYVETSAKDGNSVEEAFLIIARIILKEQEEQQDEGDSFIVVDKNNLEEPKAKTCWCC